MRCGGSWQGLIESDEGAGWLQASLGAVTVTDGV